MAQCAPKPWMQEGENAGDVLNVEHVDDRRLQQLSELTAGQLGKRCRQVEDEDED